MFLFDGDSGNVRDDIGQLIDSYHPVLAQIERFVKIGPHQAVDSL